MEKFHKIRPIRILLWVLFFTLFVFIIYFFDTKILQRNPTWIIPQYSDVLMAIWQVQASVSTLTLSATAFIIGRVNVTYFGVCIKDLLHLTNGKKMLGLSFWESIIVALLLLFVTGIFILLNNFFSVVVVASFALYLTIQITLECINVICESKKYSEQARTLVEGLVKQVIEEKVKTESHHKVDSNEIAPNVIVNTKETAQEHLGLILDRFHIELSNKISANVDLRNDPYFAYYRRILTSLLAAKEESLSSAMFETLNSLLRTAIEQKSDKNIAGIISSSLTTSNYENMRILKAFLVSYYAGYVEPRCFRQIIDIRLSQFGYGVDDQFDVALTIIQQSLVNCDRDTLRKAIRAVYSMPTSNRKKTRKGSILLIAFAYLYYLSYREQEFVISKGSASIDELRNFINEVIVDDVDENKVTRAVNILSDIRLLFEDLNRVIKYFNDNNMDLEITIYSTKWLHLDLNIMDFVFFVLMIHYNRSSIKLNTIEFPTLLSLKERQKNDGSINDQLLNNFANYCSWINQTYEPEYKNMALLNALTATIKEKLLSETKIERENLITHNEWQKVLRETLINSFRESSVFQKTPCEECEVISIAIPEIKRFQDIGEPSEYQSFAEFIKSRIEQRLFGALSERLDSFNFEADYDHPDESFKRFMDILEEINLTGLSIDQSYNDNFFDVSAYFPFSDNVTTNFLEAKDRILKVGAFFADLGSAIYIDSSTPKMGFTFNESNFITFEDNLKTEDIDRLLREHQVGDSSIYHWNHLGVQLQYSEGELRELVQQTMIKITYSIQLIIPKQKIGFYTVAEDDEVE